MQIARILRFLVALELLGAAALAVWLNRTQGWSPAGAVATGLAAPVLVHFALVLANFGLAALAGSPKSAEHHLAPGAWLRMVLREFADSFRTFQYAIPWRSPAPLAGQQGGAQEIPVLLIHGYACNRQVWRPLARWLAERGHAVDAVDLDPALASIDDYVPLVSAAVQQLRERTGAHRVALVCHSMGGLVARAWMRDTGGELAARVITLGTPHRGTFHANFGLDTSTRQMRVDSPWLQALEAAEPPDLGTRFTVVLSHHDNIVAPQSIQTLAGARTVAFHGIGHVSLVYDPRVWAVVDDALGWAD